MHFVNMCQILKRQDKLTEECIHKLHKLLTDETVDSIMEVGISLILSEKKTFEHWTDLCDKPNMESMKCYPIWKYYTELK